MNDLDLMVRPTPAGSAVVPMDYAEKAMGSLMQLHSELMEEKERRVDLYRRLMEKEQAVAELRMYVKLLEEKLAKPAERKEPEPEPAPPAPAEPPALRSVPRPPPPPSGALRLVRPRTPSAVVSAPRAPPRPPAPPRASALPPLPRPTARRFAASDGWKAW
jgi:hypothetical protein